MKGRRCENNELNFNTWRGVLTNRGGLLVDTPDMYLGISSEYGLIVFWREKEK